VRPLRAASIRFAVRHPGQVALSVAGIAVGVALFVGITLANASVRRAFLLSAQTLAGASTHVIVGGPLGLPENLWPHLRRAGLGVPIAPVVEGDVLREGTGEVIHVFGIDVFSEAAVRPALMATNAGGSPGKPMPASWVAALLTQPGAIVLPVATAQRFGVKVGERVHVRAGAALQVLQVVGILGNGDAAGLAGTNNLALADLATAQELLGMQGRLSRIDVRAEDNAAALAKVRARLPPDATLEPAGARAGALSQMTRAFDLNLTALSLLALLVGAFLVANTLTFAVIRRRRDLAVMRTIGATRRQVVSIVLWEAAALGGLGAVLGVALGAGLARILVKLVSRAINDLYFVVDVQGVSWPTTPFVVGLALGCGGAVVAAWPAAREAAHTTPRMALLRSTLEATSRRTASRLAWWGLLSFVLAGALVALPGSGLGLAFAGLFFLVVGAAALAPAAVAFCVQGLLWLLRRAGPPSRGAIFRLALANIGGSLSRTGIAAAALSTALSVSVGVSVMVQSFRTSVADWLNATLVADVYVTAPQLVTSRSESHLPRDLYDRLRALPEVDGASTYRGSFVTDTQGRAFLVALDLDVRQKAALHFIDGAPEPAWKSFDAGHGVFVSEPWAQKRQRGVGGVVRLPTRAGDVTLPIVAVFRDFGSEGGTVMIDARAAHRLFSAPDEPAPPPSSIALFGRPGISPDALARAAERIRRPDEALVIRPSRVLREMSLVIFDRTFAVTRVLQVLSLLVAGLGVMGALLARAWERTRELGVLRALGLTPNGVGRLLGYENALVGLMAGLWAAPLGLLLSAVLVIVINKRSFGWSLDLVFAPATLLLSPLFGALAACVAGLPPLLHARRTSAAEALRDE